jgi:hypothetical protein
MVSFSQKYWPAPSDQEHVTTPRTATPRTATSGTVAPRTATTRTAPTEKNRNLTELNWHCTPDSYSKHFIQFHAAEQAKIHGFDKAALRSNIHNSTRGPVPRTVAVPYSRTTRAPVADGELRLPRPYKACDYHFTLDFHNPTTNFWEPAHVYTLTRRVGRRPNGKDKLVHEGLVTDRDNPEFYPPTPRGHFKGKSIETVYM